MFMEKVLGTGMPTRVREKYSVSGRKRVAMKAPALRKEKTMVRVCACEKGGREGRRVGEREERGGFQIAVRESFERVVELGKKAGRRTAFERAVDRHWWAVTVNLRGS